MSLQFDLYFYSFYQTPVYISQFFYFHIKRIAFFIYLRLQTANPSLSKQSVHILLEQGLVQVSGGMSVSPSFRAFYFVCPAGSKLFCSLLQDLCSLGTFDLIL